MLWATEERRAGSRVSDDQLTVQFPTPDRLIGSISLRPARLPDRPVAEWSVVHHLGSRRRLQQRQHHGGGDQLLLSAREAFARCFSPDAGVERPRAGVLAQHCCPALVQAIDEYLREGAICWPAPVIGHLDVQARQAMDALVEIRLDGLEPLASLVSNSFAVWLRPRRPRLWGSIPCFRTALRWRSARRKRTQYSRKEGSTWNTPQSSHRRRSPEHLRPGDEFPGQWPRRRTPRATPPGYERPDPRPEPHRPPPCGTRTPHDGRDR